MAGPAGGGNHPKERYGVPDHGKYSSNFLYFFSRVFICACIVLAELVQFFSAFLFGGFDEISCVCSPGV